LSPPPTTLNCMEITQKTVDLDVCALVRSVRIFCQTNSRETHMSTEWSRLFGYKSNHKSENISTIDLLSRVPLFEDLSRRELSSVEQILHRRRYLQNEVIFRQGERGIGMYILEKGVVTLSSEPVVHQLCELKEGDFFGEVALLDELPRSATAVAKTDCEIFGFFQPDLFGLIKRDSRLGVKIVVRVSRIIGQRLRQSNERALALATEVETLKRQVANNER
jgi:CRP/FNR family cyclic AMP-dependent transcriptional regulator